MAQLLSTSSCPQKIRPNMLASSSTNPYINKAMAFSTARASKRTTTWTIRPLRHHIICTKRLHPSAIISHESLHPTSQHQQLLRLSTSTATRAHLSNPSTTRCESPPIRLRTSWTATCRYSSQLAQLRSLPMILVGPTPIRQARTQRFEWVWAEYGNRYRTLLCSSLYWWEKFLFKRIHLTKKVKIREIFVFFKVKL